MEVQTEKESLEAIQKGNRGIAEAVGLFFAAPKISSNTLHKIISRYADERSEREKNLRTNRSNELSFIARIYSIDPKSLCRSMSSIHGEMATRELETCCRVAVSLSKEDNGEDIWNALFDIWCTAYPTHIINLSAEQLSLLHERSLHKLQSLENVKSIDSIEHLIAIYEEIGVPREIIAKFLTLVN